MAEPAQNTGQWHNFPLSPRPWAQAPIAPELVDQICLVVPMLLTK
jgi:hypothetical protein